MKLLVTTLAAMLTITVTATAQAFCGFYVAKADTSLFNQASQVVLVRDGDRAVIQHLDAYTSPRLVEYHDGNPCVVYDREEMMRADSVFPAAAKELKRSAHTRGVTIEAQYTVGEYDILILSAEESSGLIRWLNENGYTIPRGAKRVVDSYLRQDMRFFIARVNLEEQSKLGYQYLRPLQVAYESNKFMLPIRLDALNAKDKQELFVYALTRTGRVETTNYRTVKLPSNVDIPAFVEDEFADFYRAMFEKQTKHENERAVFLEYAWDMGWCDPCAANPLSAPELRQVGVFWLGKSDSESQRPIQPQAQNVFVTRLHVRYDAEHFPEDPMFQETGDRQNFQGRYVIRHPWQGDASCDLSQYHTGVRERQEREAQLLANLTGWDIDDIRGKIPFAGGVRPETEKEPWWMRLWD